MVPSDAPVPRVIGKPRAESIDARMSLADAFVKLGGTAGLVRWGRKNRTEFYKLWSRLLPRDVTVNPGEGLEAMLERLAEVRGPAPVDADYTELRGASVPQPEEDQA